MYEPKNALELTVLMPCLNEARTVGACIEKALTFLRESGVEGEVLVADNGSTDGSREIAQRLGARVLPVAEKGYGNALRAGIEAARGRFIIMGDSDDSYDFLCLGAFIEKLRDGYDLVLGNRFTGGIRAGAMPPLHRFFGNPLITLIGRVLYRSPSRDFYCGLRGFRATAIRGLDLDATGMEFALEMVVKATIGKLAITEVPTTLSPDGRDRPPHLRSWRDGWRSLRFFLLLSPRGLFLYPGVVVLAFGLAIVMALVGGDRSVGSVIFAEHTFLIGCTAIIIGVQAVSFWIFAKLLAIENGLLPPDPTFERVRRWATVEAGALAGSVLLLVGVAGDLFGLIYWGRLSFGPVDHSFLIRVVGLSSVAMVLGCQALFVSFFIYLFDYVAARRGRMRPDAQALIRSSDKRVERSAF